MVGPSFSGMDIPSLTPEQVVEHLDAGERLAFVDARSPRACASAAQEIPRSIRVSPDHPFPYLDDELRTATVIVYCTCTAEHSSSRVALRIMGLGFTSVYVLCGGLDAWKEAGFPLRSLRRQEAFVNGVDHQVM